MKIYHTERFCLIGLQIITKVSRPMHQDRFLVVKVASCVFIFVYACWCIAIYFPHGVVFDNQGYKIHMYIE